MAEANMKEEGEGDEQSLGLLEPSLPARTLLVHNAALRRNFEKLKQLFMKLSEANISLQETCRGLQLEKLQGHGSNTSLKTEELPAILSSKENDALMKEIDVLRLERNQAMAEREAMELEYIKLFSLKGEENNFREKAGDLADKCKYLEIDLETACVAGEAAHGQLLKVAYEKDVIILELEKAAQKLQENIRILEDERKADYKTWSKERQELIKNMDEIERDKAKYSEMSQTLKSEIGDLHGMLDAMEHATQDAELRHANAVEFVKEENSLLKKDVDKARKDLKLVKETILKTQKEITEMHAEAAGLRAQLQDALNDAHQYQQNSVNCMHANEQLRQSLMGAQENISELIKLRKEDEILYLQQLKGYQMDWEMEREKLLEANNRDTGDRFAKLTKQNYILKKRLKQSYQVLALITCDCNKLKQELKVKSMLAKEGKGIVDKASAETESVTLIERQSSKYGQHEDTREELAVPTFYRCSKRRPLHSDMTHLAQRQIKLLDSLVAT